MDDYAISEMDQWLTNLKKDTSKAPILQKIVNAKPADLVDSCWTESGRLGVHDLLQIKLEVSFLIRYHWSWRNRPSH